MYLSAVGAASSPVSVLYMFTIPRCPFNFLFHSNQSSGPLSFGIFDASWRELIMVWSDIIGEDFVVEKGKKSGERGGIIS